VKNKKAPKVLFGLCQKLSIKKPVNKQLTTVQTINIPLGNLSFKGIPSLFTNLSVWLKRVLLAILRIIGMIKMVIQQKAVPYDLFDKLKVKNHPMVNPALIPNQNTKFQKLSLFFLALIKSCIAF